MTLSSQTRGSEHQLVVLKTIAEHLNRFLDLDSMLESVLPLVLELTGLNAGWIVLREEGGVFSLAAAHGLPPGLEAEGRAALRQSPCRCQKLVASGELRESIRLLPCERLERLYQSLQGESLASVQRLTGGLAAHATVPLRSGEEVLGILNVAHPEGRSLSEEELTLLTLVGSVIGTAIHRARIYARHLQQTVELERTNRLLNALVEIASQAGLSPEPDTVLETVGNQLQRLGITCAVGLVDPHDQSLELRYTNLFQHRLERLTRLISIFPSMFRVPRERYWRPEIFEQGQCVIERDPQALLERAFPGLPGVVRKQVAATLGFNANTSFLHLPLRVEERIIGVLSLWGRDWQEADIPAFSAFANQVATALHVAQLYEQLRASRVREQEVLLELTSALVGLTDPESVLQAAVHAARRALGVEWAAFWEPVAAGKHLMLRASAGGAPPPAGPCRLNAESSPEGQAYRTGEPFQQVGASPSWPPAVRERGLVGALLVPVPGDRQPAGVLGAYVTEAHEFTPEDQRLLSLIAAQVAVALRRTQAHQALQASEARYRGLFHGVPVGLFRLAPDGRFLEANDVLLELLGEADRDALLARRLEDVLVGAEAWQRVQALAAGEPGTLDLETPVRRVDGSTLWARLVLRAVPDAEGETHHIEGSLEDVTDRHWAEQRYRRLFEEAPVMYIITRNQGGVPIIEDCNRAFLDTLGYERDQVVGRPLGDFYTPASREALLEGGGYARALNNTFTTEERQLVARDGQVIETMLYAVPELNPAGKVIGTRAAFVNITPLRRAERALQRERNRLAAQGRILAAILDPTLELDALLTLIVQEAIALLGVESGGAYIVQGQHAVLRVWHGISDTFRARVSCFPVEAAPAWLREPQVVRERLSEEGRIHANTKAEGIQVWASIPLHLPVPTGESPAWVGTLIVASRRYEALEEADLQALQTMGTQMALAIDHHRTFRQAQERLARLRALHEIDRAILQHLDLEDVLRTLLEHIPPQLGADAVGISLLDADRQHVRLFAMRLPNGTLIHEQAFDLANSLLHWFVERQEPVVIHDLATDPRVQAYRSDIRGWRLVSYLGAPLVVRGETVGVLHILTTRPKVFSDEEVEFFRTIAGQAAIAIDNAMAFADLAQRAEAVEFMLAAQADIAGASPDRFITTMLAGMSRATSSPQTAFFRLDEAAQTLVLDATRGLSKDALKRHEFHVGEEEGLVGLVALTRRSLYLPDGHDDSRWLAAFPAARSAYLVPVQSGQRLFGVVTLLAAEPHAFPAPQRSLVDLFAYYAGTALENAHLLAETRRHADYLATLNTIIAAGASATELRSLLETVLYHTQHALGVNGGAIWAPDYAVTNGVPPEIGLAVQRRAQRYGLDIPGPIVVSDWEALPDDAPSAALKPVMRQYGIRASLTVPLVHRGRRVGGISLASSVPRVWKPDEVALVEAVGRDLGGTVERLRLFQDAQERAERMEALAALGEMLNRSLTEEQVIRAVGRGALALSAASRAAVYVRNRDVFVCAWYSDPPPEPNNQVAHWMWNILNRSPVERGEPILVPDVEAWPEKSLLRRTIEAEGGRAAGLWPLVYEDEVIAVVTCYYTAPYLWSEVDQEVFRHFSRQAAAVLMNARHLQAEQVRRRELAALYDMSRHLVLSDDLQTVAETIAREALALVGGTFCRLLTVEDDDTFLCRAARAAVWFRHSLDKGEPAPPVVSSFYRHVLAQDQPVVVHRDSPDLDAVTRTALGLDAVRQLCLVPLRVGREAIGLLVFGEARSALRAPFDQERLQRIVAVADQAASALYRSRLHAELEDAYLQTALALAKAVDARDTYTADHSERMAKWAVAVARELGLSESDVEAVRLGALLHDIGKIGVPDHILRKPGRLTDEEWTIVKKHPEVGAEIVAPVKKLAPVVAIIHSHQERWDGTGYPEGLRGEEIPIGARILAVVDAYSAITDERPYKPARTHEEAVEELRRCAGTQFDPRVVEVFIRVLEREA